jgi:predicted transcriptional regulator
LSAAVLKICGITLNMSKSRKVRFRLGADKIEALDAIACSSNRGRSSLLSEAVANYLDLQAYHADLIEEGLRAVTEQRTISSAELHSKIASYTSRRRTNPKK